MKLLREQELEARKKPLAKPPTFDVVAAAERAAAMRNGQANGNGHRVAADDADSADRSSVASVPSAANRWTSRPQASSGKLSRNSSGPRRELIELGVPVQVAIDLIHPHPKNRRPNAAAVKALAESIREHELQQPILVRVPPAGSQYPLASGHVQIVFGERRYAAHKQLGRESIVAYIRDDLDDVATLKLMAEENAKREDLDPIERARLIETLTQPIEQGGGGLQVKEAAAHVGFEDPASASNSLRLLKLPKPWQTRVAAGELPETFARLLVPICHAPKLMDIANAIYEAEQKGKRWKPPKGLDWPQGGFETRRELEELVQWIIQEATRPVGEGEKRRCDPFDLGLNDWKYSGDFPMLFEADAATLAKLDVREFEIGKQTRTLATNWQLYDHLQKPCVKKHVDQQEQKKAERAGRDRRGPSRTLSAEEKKRKARQATENHTKRLAWWRTKLLRRACIAAIDAGLDSGLRLVLAFAADSRTPNGGLSMAEALEEVRATDSKPGDYRRNEWRANYWACVAAIDGQPKTQHDDEGFVVAELAKRLLAHESKDWRQPTVLPALVEGYSAALGINVAQEWGKLQLPGDGRQLLEELFRLHQTDPLWNLGAEMGQPLARHFTRKQIIKELMAKLDFGSRLKAPKFLKPLAAKATKSTTSTKRKR